MANAYERIAHQARKHEKVQMLMHYVNKQNLIEEHKQQSKGKAMGIDKVSKEAYGEDLEAKIDNLLSRMKTFSYRPQAVRRTYIPKVGRDKNNIWVDGGAISDEESFWDNIISKMDIPTEYENQNTSAINITVEAGA